MKSNNDVLPAFDTEVINAIRQEEAGTIQGAKLIQAGELVAFPTETVYGLGADGLNGEAVAKIFAAKGRPSDNPLIEHVAKKSDVRQLWSRIPKQAQILMDTFWPGPLTIVAPKSELVPDEVQLQPADNVKPERRLGCDATPLVSFEMNLVVR